MTLSTCCQSIGTNDYEEIKRCADCGEPCDYFDPNEADESIDLSRITTYLAAACLTAYLAGIATAAMFAEVGR